MSGNISLFTYGAASLGFAVLSILLLAQWRVRPLGPSLLFASAATVLWAGTIAVGTLYPYPPVTLIQFSELARGGGWLFFLLQLLGYQAGGSVWVWLGRRWLGPFAAAVIAASAIILLRPLGQTIGMSNAEAVDAAMTLWLALAVAALLLVEQVYRNASNDERWGLKFLCLGLGAMFIYDFLMYAEALLFRQLDAQLWQAGDS